MKTTFQTEANDLHEYIARMHLRLSETAKDSYSACMKTIARAAGANANGLTAYDAVAALVDKVRNGDLSYSSFRQYKSAIQYWLGQQGDAAISTGADFASYDKAFSALKNLTFADLAPENPGIGRARLKHFPDFAVDALRLYAEAKGRASYYADGAKKFVLANLLVGLRPMEWFDARLSSYLHREPDGRFRTTPDGKLVFTIMLIVRNAKHTHGRGNGPYRELLLHGVTRSQLEAIAEWQSWLQRHFDRQPSGMAPSEISDRLFRGAITKLLRRVLAKASVSAEVAPTVYSTRHQCVSDLKASGATPEEIAAFFGHSSVETAREHYGKRGSGSSGRLFRASRESLQAVRRKSLEAQINLGPEKRADLHDWHGESESRRNGVGAPSRSAGG